MNTQQRLADIQNLLQYVKGVLDTPAHQDITETLEGVGHMTLDLVTSLTTLDTNININQKEALASHTQHVSDTSQAIVAKLEEVQHLISESGDAHKTELAQIQTLCQEYAALSQQSIDTITQQATSTADTLHTICDDTSQTMTKLQEIQDGLIDKKHLGQFIQKFETLVAELAQQDVVADTRTQEAMQQITTRIDNATGTLSTISEQLSTIEDGFQTSMGRLNVIDVKLDTIIEVVADHA